MNAHSGVGTATFVASRAAIRVVFLVDGILVGSWFSRIPDAQAALGLSKGELGVALAAMQLGTIMLLPFASSIGARGSERATIAVILVTLALLLPAIALAGSFAYLIAALFAFGSMLALVEVAMNGAAHRYEMATGTRIMASCHGFWSLGAMLGGFGGSAAVALALSPLQHFGLIAALAIAVTAWCVTGLGATRHEPEPNARVFALPSPAILLLCLACTATVIVEGAMADWAAIYMRDVQAADASLNGAGYGVFAGLMALARLVGDRVIERFGPVMVMRASGLLSATGLLLLAITPPLPLAFLGFALIGVGTAGAFPVVVSAAARRTDRPAGEQVAAVTLTAVTGLFIGPPILGAAADQIGLALTLGLLIPVVLLTTLLARETERVR
jgi:MFS family permease